MRKILALLVIALLPTMHAADFSQYVVGYDSVSSQVKISFIVALENTTGLDVAIFSKPEDLKVETSVPSKSSVTENNGWNVAIDFLQPATGNVSVTLSFKADLVEELKERNLFTFVFQSPGNIDNFLLKLILPQGSTVYKINNKPVVSPEAEITTDGQRIILQWEDSLNQGNERVFLASYTSPNQASYLLPLLGIIAAITLFGGLYLYTHTRSKKIVYKALSEDEQTVYEIVKKEKGTTQDRVREISGFSKSKLSKVVRNLEHKGVLRKVPYKKTNKLELKI
jgi:uncharacterized membrane protein